MHYKNFKVFAVIPARSGSKSIRNKNIKKINNNPLIYYTIDTALKSKFIDNLCFSSDSETYLNIARSYGVKNLIKRPKSLSNEKALSYEVVFHALKKTEKILETTFDAVLLLQPTNPLRRLYDIDFCIKKLRNNQNKYDSIVSVVDVGGIHPDRMKIIDKNGLLKNYLKFDKENMIPRQNLKKIYIRSGDIYLISRDSLLKNKSLVGNYVFPYIKQVEETINIDNLTDFEFAKIKLKNYK